MAGNDEEFWAQFKPTDSTPESKPSWAGAVLRRNLLGDYGNKLFGGDPQADRAVLADNPISTAAAQACMGAIAAP